MFLDVEMLPTCCILVDIVRHYQGRGYKDETTHVGTQYLNKVILATVVARMNKSLIDYS
jgi:hypothetical protein